MFLFVSRLDKGLLEATSNHLGLSWAQSGIKMAQLGSRLLQEGVVGSRHKQKLIFPWFFNDFKGQSKTMSGPCWVHFGPKS
jgi:hypothetical protein